MSENKALLLVKKSRAWKYWYNRKSLLNLKKVERKGINWQNREECFFNPIQHFIFAWYFNNWKLYYGIETWKYLVQVELFAYTWKKFDKIDKILRRKGFNLKRFDKTRFPTINLKKIGQKLNLFWKTGIIKKLFHNLPNLKEEIYKK